MTIGDTMKQAELTNVQIHLLERSFKWLSDDPVRFSKQFRKRLLKSHPGFVTMLEHISDKHFQVMVMACMTFLLQTFKYPTYTKVVPQLLHKQYYTPQKLREIYDACCISLMDVLLDIAEDSWCPALESAWTTFLIFWRRQIFQCAQHSHPALTIQNSPFDFVTRKVHSRALIVDDDEHVRKTLCSYLNTLGCDCYEAENGAVALYYLEGILPIDVVITENHMPVLNGLQLLEALAHLPKAHRPPCILCSRNLSQDSVEKALELGAWAIMAKPYSYDDLHTTMNQAIESH